MYFTGFADEASKDFDLQLKATQELGWKNIETRGLMGGNLANISDHDFDVVCEKLAESGISFNCYGSAIANGAKLITKSPDSSYEEMRIAIPRMHKLNIKQVRIMSFAVPKELKPQSWELFDEVVKRIKVLVKMAEEAGIVCMHENCSNWGGLSYEHTLKLLEAIDSPNLKLVFDTGNPVFSEDVRGIQPYAYQSAWEFYDNVKEHVAYVHIKDGVMKDDEIVFTFAGEGDGNVDAILTDLFKRGYDGGISIEPHMGKVFHDPDKPEKSEELCYRNYVEYGQKMMAMVDKIKTGLNK